MPETTLKLEHIADSTEYDNGFDIAASVRMLKEDIHKLGYISHETWQQVYNEELTYVAEGINAPLRTRFEIPYEKEVGLMNERGEPLLASYQAGYRSAQAMASRNPGLVFEANRRSSDLEEILELEKMMSGETDADTMVVFSPFPEEAYRQNGGRELEMIGYQPQRQMGFMRICRKLDDNTLEQISISLDTSDLQAFTEAGKWVNMEIPYGTISDDYQKHRTFFNSKDITFSEDLLLNVYDQSIGRRYGRKFKAGRPIEDEVNAWDFISAQKDLCDYYFVELERLARANMSHEAEKHAKTAMTAGFWAALKNRLSANGPGIYEENIYTGSEQHRTELAAEMSFALEQAEANHEVMVGCGGGIQLGDKELLAQTPENILASVFGGSSSEKWVWKKGKCLVENCPTQPKEVEVGPCSVCKGCQGHFDKGIDPKFIYKHLKGNDQKTKKIREEVASLNKKEELSRAA